MQLALRGRDLDVRCTVRVHERVHVRPELCSGHKLKFLTLEVWISELWDHDHLLWFVVQKLLKSALSTTL